MALAPPFVPSPEQVAKSWIVANVPGITEAMVATTLPEPAVFADNGFVQLLSLPNTSLQVDLPIFDSTLQVDAWATKLDGVTPPWGKAASLAMAIAGATFATSYSFRVATPANFFDAWVTEASVMVGPQRVGDDPSNYARYSLDLLLKWAILPA